MVFKLHAFDAYGTLFDVHSAVARQRTAIGPEAARLSEIWRNKQLEYTWVRTLMGAYADFQTLTEQALDFAATQCGGLDAMVRNALLESYQTLDAYEDVGPALQALRSSGSKIAILSNGTANMLENAAKAAGIFGLIDSMISADQIGRYKTVADVYTLASDTFQLSPAEVSFQSSNRWDIAGAKQFGFRTVWVNRTNQPDEYADLPADHSVNSLAALSDLTA